MPARVAREGVLSAHVYQGLARESHVRVWPGPLGRERPCPASHSVLSLLGPQARGAVGEHGSVSGHP